jgi:hypothetical protein
MSTLAESRKAAKAARREESSGAGPTLDGWVAPDNPGATARFGLFGEVLTTGLLVTLVGLLIVTLPVGLAAGVRHLRRFVAAEDSRTALFWADVRRGLVGGAVVGVVSVAIGVVLAIDIALARSGALPGGAAIEVIGWVGLAALAVTLLMAAAVWTPELGWRGAVRSVPGAVRSDIAGTLYVVATAAFVVVTTWALIPLFIPAIGCATLALVAIPARRRGRGREQK